MTGPMKDGEGLRPASGRGDLHANMAWVKENSAQYGGHWVALRDGELVAASSVSRTDLQAQLADRPDVRELTVLYVGLTPDRIVRVPADHPAWEALDDDDWNGHTFSNWLGRLKGKTVVIVPPAGYGEKLGRFLAALLNAGAERIVAGSAEPLDAGNFCADCFPLAEDMERSLTDARYSVSELCDTLKRLAAAAEAVAYAQRETSEYEEIMDEFENVLDEARYLIKNGPQA